MAVFARHGIEADAVDVTATVKTFMRITAVRTCRVAFRVDGLSTDSAGKKIVAGCYKNRTGGTPGSSISSAFKNTDSEDAAVIASVATIAGTFSSQSGLSGGDLADDFTIHPQYHGTSTKYVKLLEDETLDLDLNVTTGGSSTKAIISTSIVSE